MNATQMRERFVHQGIVAPILVAAHLTQNRGGVAALAPGQGPQRNAIPGVVKVKTNCIGKPRWQLEIRGYVRRHATPQLHDFLTGAAPDESNRGLLMLPVR